ncbi:hypothetical protein AGMMS50268_15120 [Spirochaetia bacterium]|nr:hypothetical protein AGMMS50268_15120 [Spirochaetia bacterium]
MSKVIDLFRKAQSDPALLADMEAIQDGQGGKYIDIGSIVGALIKVAADHGISLERSDFRYNYGELADAELASVVGGCSHLAKLWLDLYNTQSSINTEEDGRQG